MRRFFLATAALVCAVSMAPTARAITADSVGGLRINVDTNFFLPLAATADLCASANPLPTAYFGPPPVACGIPLAKPAIGLGVFNTPKFPGGAGTTVTATEINLVVPPIVTAVASFTSSVGVLINDADLSTVANVAGAGGRAVALSQDPWFFTPDVDVDLHLEILLDRMLSVTGIGSGESGSASIFSHGAFGVGSTPGENPLAGWSNEMTIFSGMFNDSMSLIDQTFSLTAGETYWLTATLIGEAVTAPEPGMLAIFGFATIVLIGAGRETMRRAVPVRHR